MVDLGKSASKIASRQVSRATTRAKSRAKSQSRAKARQIGRGLKKDAIDKAKGHKTSQSGGSTKARHSGGVDLREEVNEAEAILELEEIAERAGYVVTRIPVGYKPPRGLKLVNGPEEIPEPFDFSRVPWKKLVVLIVLLIAAPFLFNGLRWAVPKVTEFVRNVDISAPSIPSLSTTSTVTPVVVITTWGEGACATTAPDGTARPSSCDGADVEVVSSIAYPDLELTTDEVRATQTLMTSLGVPVVIDGILGPQTRRAMDTFATNAGLDAAANDRARQAAVRAASLSGGSAPDGPRLVQNTPELCGAGVNWVEDTTQIHCLAPLG
jgi:hypothetical protein